MPYNYFITAGAGPKAGFGYFSSPGDRSPEPPGEGNKRIFVRRIYLRILPVAEIDLAGSLSVFEELSVDLLSELRMSDVDEGLASLCQRFSEQVSYTVLGDDIMYVLTGRGDRGSGLEGSDDPGNLAVLRGGRKSDDGLAVLGLLAASQEVQLSADSGEHLASDGIRYDLTHAVDFQSGVDGNYVVILGDDADVIGEVYRHELDQLIVIGILVEILGSLDEGGHDLAREYGLSVSGDDSLFDEGDQVV